MGKKVSELESLKDLETEKKTEAETKTRKVKMIRTVCRPEGAFQSDRTYEVPGKLAETFIKNKFAEEAK